MERTLESAKFACFNAQPKSANGVGVVRAFWLREKRPVGLRLTPTNNVGGTGRQTGLRFAPVLTAVFRRRGAAFRRLLGTPLVAFEASTLPFAPVLTAVFRRRSAAFRRLLGTPLVAFATSTLPFAPILAAVFRRAGVNFAGRGGFDGDLAIA